MLSFALRITKLMLPSAYGAMTGPLPTKEAHGGYRCGIRYSSPWSSTNKAAALEFPFNMETGKPAKGPSRVILAIGRDDVRDSVSVGSTEAESTGLPLGNGVAVGERLLPRLLLSSISDE